MQSERQDTFLLEEKTGFLLLVGEITQSMKFQESSPLDVSSVYRRITKTLVSALVHDCQRL